MQNDRLNAQRGETVRLYSKFYKDNELTNPADPGVVYIRDADMQVVEGTIVPTFESIGTYFVEWDIPEDQELGYYNDLWSGLQYSASSNPTNHVFNLQVLYNASEGFEYYEEPDPEGFCRVFEFFRNSDGSPLKNATTVARVLSLHGSNQPPGYDDEITNVTDNAGKVSWYVPKGSEIQVHVPALGFTVRKRVSLTLDSDRLEDLRE